MNDSNQNTHQQTPLATRVSSACDRCKRNKSRCDIYRPCSLCLRASTECRSVNTRPATWRRPGSTTETLESRPQNGKRRRKANLPGGDGRRLRSVHRLQSFETINDTPETVNFVTDPGDTRSDSGDDGEAESTISMARKVYSLDQQQLMFSGDGPDYKSTLSTGLGSPAHLRQPAHNSTPTFPRLAH